MQERGIESEVVAEDDLFLSLRSLIETTAFKGVVVAVATVGWWSLLLFSE